MNDSLGQFIALGSRPEPSGSRIAEQPGAVPTRWLDLSKRAASGLWSRLLLHEGPAAVDADDDAALPQHFHRPADRLVGDLVVGCKVAF